VCISNCSRLSIDEFDELRNNLIRRLFHEPVPGVANDDAFNICGYKPALLNQKITRSFFLRKNKHWHWQWCLGESGEILRIPLECAKNFKASAHAAGSSIGFSVNLTVALCHDFLLLEVS